MDDKFKKNFIYTTFQKKSAAKNTDHPVYNHGKEKSINLLLEAGFSHDEIMDFLDIVKKSKTKSRRRLAWFDN
jgi:hypothetical protein